MRILHVIDSLATGGKERQLVELLKGLKAEPGIACEVAVMPDAIAHDMFGVPGIEVHILPRSRRYDLSLFARLLRILKHCKPDIVHSWNSMCSVYAAPLARLVGAKFVNGFVRAAPSGLTLRDRDYFRGRITQPLSDAVVANSLAGLAAYRVSAKRSICIRNGFDMARVAGLAPPEEFRRSLGIVTRHVVGIVASFSAYKDYDSWFAMARRMTEARTDVTFLAAGAGENFETYRRAWPKERYPRIKLLGYRPDVESIVNIFTVGVLTSNQGEGCSNAIMEYMALGKPVVASDCGGNRELVGDGVTGYLVAERDVDALCAHVARLLDDDELSRAMGERGHARIREAFSLERMTGGYLNLYRDLLDGNR